VVTRHWFEIVRRGFDRYAWLFVEVQGDRRRVLARSTRDWGSRKKVRKAIRDLKRDVPGARIIDTTRPGDRDRFRLPATAFQFVPRVMPLVVRESPLDDDSVVARRQGAPAWLGEPDGKRSEAEVPVRQAAVQQEVAQPAATAQAAPAPERAPRQGGRQPRRT
jgi:hypothetical protein